MLIASVSHIKSNLLGISILILAYGQGVLRESAWSDDYAALANKEGMQNLQLVDGRTLAALIIPQSFELVGEPSKLWILRCLALLGLILLYFQTTSQIKKEKKSRSTQIIIAIAFCTPGFQMYVHWAQTWSYLWASVLGVIGFEYWKKQSRFHNLLGVLFLAVSILIYPPAALFYFSLMLVSGIINENPTKILAIQLVQGIKFLFVSGIVSLVVIAISLHIYGVDRTERLRLVSTSEILEKLTWFITRPIVTGLRPFLIDSPEPYLAAVSILPVIAILFFGIKSQTRMLNERNAPRILIFFLMASAPLIPILISPENQIEFRLIVCFGWAIALLSLHFATTAISDFLNSRKWLHFKGEYLRGLLISIIVFLAIFDVNQRYNELFKDSYQRKNLFLNAAVSDCTKDFSIQRVRLIAPKEKFPLKNNLGVYSMQTDLYGPWVSIPNMKVILQEMKINAPILYVEERETVAYLSQPSEGECVVDLENFRKKLLDNKANQD